MPYIPGIYGSPPRIFSDRHTRPYRYPPAFTLAGGRSVPLSGSPPPESSMPYPSRGERYLSPGKPGPLPGRGRGRNRAKQAGSTGTETREKTAMPRVWAASATRGAPRRAGVGRRRGRGDGVGSRGGSYGRVGVSFGVWGHCLLAGGAPAEKWTSFIYRETRYKRQQNAGAPPLAPPCAPRFSGGDRRPCARPTSQPGGTAAAHRRSPPPQQGGGVRVPGRRGGALVRPEQFPEPGTLRDSLER